MAIRPNCECSDRDLPADSPDALVCSFECTFCRACDSVKLHGKCPNCGGNLTVRPIRACEKWAKNPPAAERVFKPAGCAAVK